jgi:hypothetical protein
MQIYELSAKEDLTHRPSSKKGCAWIKIGYMLQELGVLPPRPDEDGREIQNLLNSFDSETRRILLLFIEDLKRTRRASGTVVKQLRSLKNLKQRVQLQFQNINLLQVNSSLMREYLDFLYQNAHAMPAPPRT